MSRIGSKHEPEFAGSVMNARIPVENSIRQQENPKTECCQENSLELTGGRAMSTEEAGGFWFRFGGGEQIGIVVTYVADAVADGPGMHFFGGEGAEQVGGGMGGIAGLEPAVVVARFEDDGHAVVESLGDLVGIGRRS